MNPGPGIHELMAEEYFLDPAPEPSLTASGIKVLDKQTPAHFAARHPRLSTWPIHERTSKQMDRGTLIHKLVLGRGRDFTIIDAGDWRTKAAKEARDAARAEGKIGVLADDLAEARVVADLLTKRLIDHYGDWPIGVSEQTIIWQRDTAHGKVWCRAMLDHLTSPAVTRIVIDFKTTEHDISDESLSRYFAAYGLDLQDAWYIEGAESLNKEGFPSLVSMDFVMAEVKPPYSIRVVQLPEDWRQRARHRIDRAADTFAKCLKEKKWPGYEPSVELVPPRWLESQWLDAELSDEIEGVVV